MNYLRAVFIAIIGISFGVAVFGCGGGSGSGADIQYVALGASDATGVGADPITKGYVYRIHDDLTSQGKSTNLINLGIPSAKIDLIRKTASGITRVENPDLITLFTGANDIAAGADVEGFQSDLDGMLAHLRDNTDAFIVIATIPDLTQLPRNVEDPNSDVTVARITQFNDAILNEAAKFNVAIADLRTIPNTGEITAADGFHPNNEGYARIAEVFLAIINPYFFNPMNSSGQ